VIGRRLDGKKQLRSACSSLLSQADPSAFSGTLRRGRAILSDLRGKSIDLLDN
jgi:hypothetical protein